MNHVFRSCRAWFNSDDGFDCINSAEVLTIENCWAFYNGYTPDFTPLADGNGVLIVATTRPETMLGDEAVAVNPTNSTSYVIVGDTGVILQSTDAGLNWTVRGSNSVSLLAVAHAPDAFGGRIEVLRAKLQTQEVLLPQVLRCHKTR